MAIAFLLVNLAFLAALALGLYRSDRHSQREARRYWLRHDPTNILGLDRTPNHALPTIAAPDVSRPEQRLAGDTNVVPFPPQRQI